MRTIEFKIVGNEIKKIPKFDYASVLKRDSNEPMQLKLTFPSEWANALKVVEFITRAGEECEPQVLVDNACMIPDKALSEYIFYMRVIGKTSDKKFETKKMAICRKGNK